MNVEVVNPLKEASWDEQILVFPESTIFHSQAWARVLQESYGLDPIYLVFRDHDRIHAALPMMEATSPLTGRRGVALPFTDNVPLLATEPVLAEEIIQKAFAMGQERRWKYLEFKGAVLIGSDALNDPPSLSIGEGVRRPAEGSVSHAVLHPIPSLAYYHHTVELGHADSDLLSAMDSATRRAIRKAEKSDVQIESADSADAIDMFYKLHVQTRRKHGLPPQPGRFFKNIYKHLITKGLGHVLLAKKEGRTVAASVFLCFGRHALFKFGASDTAWQSLRANNLLMWRAIKDFSNRGLATLDLGRCSIENEGLRRFKSGFGVREDQIKYYRYAYSRGQFVVHRDFAFNWSNRAFQLMPNTLSRIVGELLYKHLA